MDCEKFDKSSMELLYGELDQLSEAALLRHLHHCTRCREIWGHLRTTRELSELPQEDPPADLFESILKAEDQAHQSLPVRERFSRAISIMAGIAMRPQVAMAAILLLMIGSSLVFVRADHAGTGQVSVTELGSPYSETPSKDAALRKTMVFEAGHHDEPSDTSSDERDAKGNLAPKPAAQEGESDATEVTGDDREAYGAAMNAYQQGSYAEAERLFSEVASGGGPQAAAAALHEGHAARNGAGCQRAAALYDAVAQKFSGRTVAAEASWHAASCYRALGQPSRAQAHYRVLAEQGPFAERAARALEELSQTESEAGTQVIAAKDTNTNATSGAVPDKKSAAQASSGASPDAKSGIAPPAPKSTPQEDAEPPQ